MDPMALLQLLLQRLPCWIMHTNMLVIHATKKLRDRLKPVPRPHTDERPTTALGNWYATVVYSLPFFFAFMLLKNNGSSVWVESALIAAFVMALLLDWLMLLLSFVVGIGVAFLAYWLTTDPMVLSTAYLIQLAIFSFAVGIGVVANYDMDRIRIEQDRLSVNGLYRHGFLLAPALAELTLAYVARGEIDNEVMQCA